MLWKMQHQAKAMDQTSGKEITHADKELKKKSW